MSEKLKLVVLAVFLYCLGVIPSYYCWRNVASDLVSESQMIFLYIFIAIIFIIAITIAFGKLNEKNTYR